MGVYALFFVWKNLGHNCRNKTNESEAPGKIGPFDFREDFKAYQIRFKQKWKTFHEFGRPNSIMSDWDVFFSGILVILFILMAIFLNLYLYIYS